MGRKPRDLLARLVYPFVVGSSSVVRIGPEAHKTYRPRTLVRLLHLLALGTTTHLYETELGLNLAYWRRLILSKVLRGSAVCRVAQPLRVKLSSQGVTFVTQWVEGREPVVEEIWAVAGKLDSILSKAGLPTWSVSPRNPRFATNFLRGSDGILYIVDFESLLLSPINQDWVDFVKLWAWYRQTVGEDGELRSFIEKCQALQKSVRRRLRWELCLP